MNASRLLPCVAGLLAIVLWLQGAELDPLPLPPPQLRVGRPLMQALQDRKSSREFSTNALPLQTLANLL